MELKWFPDTNVHKLIGTSRFPLRFDGGQNVWEEPNERVEAFLKTLIHKNSGQSVNAHTTLETELELMVFGSVRFGSDIIVAGDLQDPEYASGAFEPFARIDFENGPVRQYAKFQDAFHKALSALYSQVSRPIRCDAIVHLDTSADSSVVRLERIDVFLPRSAEWMDPSLCAYRPGGTFVADTDEKFRSPVHSTDTAECSLVWDESREKMTILPHATTIGSYSLEDYNVHNAEQNIDTLMPLHEVFTELRLVPEHQSGSRLPRIAVRFREHDVKENLNSFIGFLPETEVGLSALLAELSLYTGGEFHCYGIIDRGTFDGRKVQVLLPRPDHFSEDLKAYLNVQDYSQGRKTELVVPPTRAERYRPLAIEALGFSKDYESVDAIDISTGGAGYDTVRSLNIKNSKTRKRIGSIEHGMLFLEDERQRDDVSLLLEEAQIDFKKPIPEFVPEVEDEFYLPHDVVPNVLVRKYPRWILFESKDRALVRQGLNLGEYNPETQILWVQDEALAHGLSRAAARHGIPVADVGIPESPWFLEEQVHYTKRKDYSDSNINRPIGGIMLGRDVDDEGRDLRVDESPQEFILREKYVQLRTDFFPHHVLQSDIMTCRLCDQPALKFSVSYCTENLAYCQFCLGKAAQGQTETDQTRVLDLIKELSDLEFGGAPPMTYQLSIINMMGRTDVPAAEIDRMLQLRSQFRPNDWSWVQLLADGGLLDGGVRTGRGINITAVDGHLCRSLYEKVIDDFLSYNDIGHSQEPPYPIDSTLNAKGRKRADWQLEDGTFVEMWGLSSDPAYAARMTEKIELADKFGIDLIGVFPDDLNNLPEIFAKWLN